MAYRVLVLIIKELQQLLRTPQSRQLLWVPVLIQLLVFPFATTLDVRNATLAVYDEDGGAAAIELTQRLAAASAFPSVLTIHDQAALASVIDAQRALIAVRIPADFSRRLAQGRPATIQAIIDGRRSNSAQIAFGYVQQIAQSFGIERAGVRPPATLEVRNAYNPNLDYKWFVLPSLVAIIATVGCLMVTALSLAREREEGTFEQLLVTPLTPGLILLGKAIPGVLVATAQGMLVAAAAVWCYGVPLTGSVALLLVSVMCYAFSLVGIGFFISAICATQQQAFLGVFSFLVPAVILSGYLAPVDNMPPFLQMVSHIDPLMYFIRVSMGIFLKDYGWPQAWPSLWPLLVIGVVTLAVAYGMFRRRSTS